MLFLTPNQQCQSTESTKAQRSGELKKDCIQWVTASSFGAMTRLDVTNVICDAKKLAQ